MLVRAGSVRAGSPGAPSKAARGAETSSTMRPAGRRVSSAVTGGPGATSLRRSRAVSSSAPVAASRGGPGAQRTPVTFPGRWPSLPVRDGGVAASTTSAPCEYGSRPCGDTRSDNSPTWLCWGVLAGPRVGLPDEPRHPARPGQPAAGTANRHRAGRRALRVRRIAVPRPCQVISAGHNRSWPVRFTRSCRKPKIGRAHAMYVIDSVAPTDVAATDEVVACKVWIGSTTEM